MSRTNPSHKTMTIQVLYNALIYTQDPELPLASALAIRRDRDDGWILAVGTDENILAEFSQGNLCQDMGGRVLIPGLCDAHIHLLHYALGLRKIDCEVPSKTECLQRVRAAAATIPPGEWILGHGWNQNDWPEGFGNADELDAAAPHHPVYLTAKSLHSAWANHAALHLAGITETTPDPQGGVLQRDADGKPTGILLEAAGELVSRAIPAPTPADHHQSMLQAQTMLLEMGITAVHDFDGQECFTALRELHHRGELQLRVLKASRTDPWLRQSNWGCRPELVMTTCGLERSRCFPTAPWDRIPPPCSNLTRMTPRTAGC